MCAAKVAQEWSKRALKIKMRAVVVVPRPRLGFKLGPKRQISVRVRVFFGTAAISAILKPIIGPRGLLKRIALIIDSMQRGWKSGKQNKTFEENQCVLHGQGGQRMVQEGFEN